MTCKDFRAKIEGCKGNIARFIYQEIPGSSKFDPSIESMGAVYSKPELVLKTTIADWDDDDYVAVVVTDTEVSLEATSDIAHANDVSTVIPGSTTVIVRFVSES